MTTSEKITGRLAYYASHTPHQCALSLLNKQLEVEKSYTFVELHRKVLTISHTFSPKRGSAWHLLLFENSFLFLPYFLAAIRQGVLPCAQEIPNSPYKMDKLVQKISTYHISQVVVQESIYYKKWFQKFQTWK